MGKIFNSGVEVAEGILGTMAKPVVESWMIIPDRVWVNGNTSFVGHIVLMDELPTTWFPGGVAKSSRYYVEHLGTLDFWNEWTGFSYVNNNIVVYDGRKSEWEYPLGSTITIRIPADGETGVQNVGDRIVTRDGSVYKVVGFTGDGLSMGSISFGVK